uniref:Uncharacterized protein n=1 Tax=Rubber tree latent virus 2 TaxID=3079710 RepID=A0AA96PML4_9VIRU|nr:hypothetical protein [Rubber tree latent virus 2]
MSSVKCYVSASDFIRLVLSPVMYFPISVSTFQESVLSCRSLGVESVPKLVGVFVDLNSSIVIFNINLVSVSLQYLAAVNYNESVWEEYRSGLLGLKISCGISGNINTVLLCGGVINSNG